MVSDPARATPAPEPELPRSLRIGHLRYRVVEDDGLVQEHSVREMGDYAGFSHAPTQTIALATRRVRGGGGDLGQQYRREVLLHEVLHCCLRVTDCDPDRDAKAGLEDVEERAVAAIAGPLLAVLQDHPDLVAYLTTSPELT
jgi:hypothetical protein